MFSRHNSPGRFVLHAGEQEDRRVALIVTNGFSTVNVIDWMYVYLVLQPDLSSAWKKKLKKRYIYCTYIYCHELDEAMRQHQNIKIHTDYLHMMTQVVIGFIKFPGSVNNKTCIYA